MYSDAKSLCDRGDRLFAQKRSLDTRNQELADHFYPERGTFTATRDLGADWASHLVTGYPSMVRRDLGDQIGAMLRPRNQAWFHMRAARQEREDHAAKQWLEYASGVMRRAVYDRVTGFTRATKEGDHDFATFGGTVLSVDMNRRDNALLFRCWHLRDVAWAEDAYCHVSEIHRDWRDATVSQVIGLFGQKRCAPKMVEIAKREPNAPAKVRHVMIRSDAFGDKQRFPWRSMVMDLDNQHVLEDVGSWTRRYVIPRWMTISGSQYPYSPAALIALPDARLIQAMSLTLLEAGEKAVNPPLVAVHDVIRGDVNLYAGGITTVDAEYDERLGEALRPLTQDRSGLPFGLEMVGQQKEMLMQAFYLNRLGLPTDTPQMTAFEAGQRVQEYIRQAMPLFEPLEHEYNGALCEEVFEVLLREGAFGSPDTIPDSIRGQEVQFSFESPLSQAVERDKGQRFLEAKAMIAEAMAIDPDAAMVMDFPATLRDVLEGIGAPAKWLTDPEAVAAAKAANAQQQEMAATLGGLEQSSAIARNLGGAAKDFAAADMAGAV